MQFNINLLSCPEVSYTRGYIGSQLNLVSRTSVASKTDKYFPIGTPFVFISRFDGDCIVIRWKKKYKTEIIAAMYLNTKLAKISSFKHIKHNKQ